MGRAASSDAKWASKLLDLGKKWMPTVQSDLFCHPLVWFDLFK